MTGAFDLERQRILADRFTTIQAKAEEIEGMSGWLNARLESYMNKNRWTRKRESKC